MHSLAGRALGGLDGVNSFEVLKRTPWPHEQPSLVKVFWLVLEQAVSIITCRGRLQVTVMGKWRGRLGRGGGWCRIPFPRQRALGLGRQGMVSLATGFECSVYLPRPRSASLLTASAPRLA